MSADFSPNILLLEGATVGADTGWIPAFGYAERFMARIDSAGTASIAMDGSSDGVTSAAQIATWSLDTTGVQSVSPPIKSPYPYIRFTVVAATAPVTLGRGA